MVSFAANGRMMARVLVVGNAVEVIKRLSKRGHEVIHWPLEKKKKTAVAKYPLFQADAGSSSEEIKKLWEEQFSNMGPQFVIACSEKSVLPAARARSTFKISRNPYRVVERFRNKKVMKEALSKVQTPMTPFIFCRKQTKLDELIATLGLPLVLKEAETSGSRGLLISSDYEELKLFPLEGKIAEKFIDSAEYSIESFIHQGEIVFTNITEYYKKTSINIVPYMADEQMQKRLLEMNKKVLQHLGVKQGMTHLEVYDNGVDLLFGEVALRPPGGYIMELLSAAYEIDAWDAYVAIELGEFFSFPKVQTNFAASYIYHPGAGVVEAVEGFEQIKKDSSCFFARCKLTPGKVVKKREGLGQNGGHFLFQHPKREELLQRLKSLENDFKIKMKTESSVRKA